MQAILWIFSAIICWSLSNMKKTRLSLVAFFKSSPFCNSAIDVRPWRVQAHLACSGERACDDERRGQWGEPFGAAEQSPHGGLCQSLHYGHSRGEFASITSCVFLLMSGMSSIYAFIYFIQLTLHYWHSCNEITVLMVVNFQQSGSTAGKL